MNVASITGLVDTIRLVLFGDSALGEIVLLSIWVSGSALLLRILVGIPIGAAMGLSRFRGHGLATTLIYTGMGLPPVVAGLIVYLLLSRSGPLGSFGARRWRSSAAGEAMPGS